MFIRLSDSSIGVKRGTVRPVERRLFRFNTVVFNADRPQMYSEPFLKFWVLSQISSIEDRFGGTRRLGIMILLDDNGILQLSIDIRTIHILDF